MQVYCTCYGCHKLTVAYRRLSSSNSAVKYIILRNPDGRAGIYPSTPAPGACSNPSRTPVYHYESEIKRGERLSQCGATATPSHFTVSRTGFLETQRRIHLHAFRVIQTWRTKEGR
jgi:hypothetical protein